MDIFWQEFARNRASNEIGVGYSRERTFIQYSLSQWSFTERETTNTYYLFNIIIIRSNFKKKKKQPQFQKVTGNYCLKIKMFVCLLSAKE